jgi:O-antigen/teichoic acid export membrane protein
MVKATRSAATAAINRYARLCAAGMGVTVLGGIVFAGPIVRLLLGDEYAQAASVCRLLFPGALFMTCALVLDAFFLNQLGRPGTLSILAAIEVVLVMGSGFLLVPRWGPNGAAVSLTLTEVAGTLVYLRWHITATGTKLREVTLVTRADLQDVGRRSTAALARVRRR